MKKIIYLLGMGFLLLSGTSWAQEPIKHQMLQLKGNSGYTMQGMEFGYSVILDLTNSKLSYLFRSHFQTCAQNDVDLSSFDLKNKKSLIQEIRNESDKIQIEFYENEYIATDCGYDGLVYFKSQGSDLINFSADLSGFICRKSGNKVGSDLLPLLENIYQTLKLSTEVNSCAQIQFLKYVLKR